MARATTTPTDWLRAQSKKVTAEPKLGAMTPEEIADAKVIAWLERHGVEFTPAVDIPLSMINERSSRANQARKEPIVNESVDRFSLAMKNGAVFPAIVVYPQSGTQVSIIDGNNREAAAKKANKTTIRGFIVDEETPSETIQLLMVEANSDHGVTPDLSWRLEQAFYLIDVLGYTDPQAATSAAVTVNQIRNVRAQKLADERAEALGIRQFTQLAPSTRGVLNALKDDAVFIEAAKAALATGMVADEVRDMIRAVKQISSEAQRVRYVQALVKERALEKAQTRALGKKTAPRKVAPKAVLSSSLTQVLRIDPAALVKTVSTRHDREALRERVHAAKERLTVIEDQLAGMSHLDEAN